VPAYAQRTLAMPTGLGTLLFGLMTLLALAIVAILIGAIREAALAPGVQPASKHRIALGILSVVVLGVIVLGKLWWGSVASDYQDMVAKPWQLKPTRDGCSLSLPFRTAMPVLPDHGHDMHLFLARMPALDVLAHLHPVRSGDAFEQVLPSLPAGHYQVFADVVFSNGFPNTGQATLDLPDLHCAPPQGDDAVNTPLANGAKMIWDHPVLKANVAQALTFRVVNADGSPATLEPYMGMAAHAEVIATDASVFAHLHPNGSVAMPALMLAQRDNMKMDMNPAMSSTLTFPFGFPKPGTYKIFVQIKRAGVIETAAFEALVN
jgi:hypothetical protein